MIKLHQVLLTGVVLALASVSAQAGFVGNLGLLGQNITLNAGSIGASSTFGTASTTSLAPGFDGLAGVPNGTSFGINNVDLSLAGSGFGFSIANAEWGNFVGTGGMIVSHTTDFLSVYITGVYTAGTSNGAPNFGPASATISFNKLGQAVLQTVIVQAPIIPEPTSVVMGAIGLASLGLVSAFRKRSTN